MSKKLRDETAQSDGTSENGHTEASPVSRKIRKNLYNKELKRLQIELIKLQISNRRRGRSSMPTTKNEPGLIASVTSCNRLPIKT